MEQEDVITLFERHEKIAKVVSDKMNKFFEEIGEHFKLESGDVEFWQDNLIVEFEDMVVQFIDQNSGDVDETNNK